MSIEGKVCIVTGAGRGIGRAIVARLTAAGAHAVGASRTLADLEETARLVAAHPGKCVVHALDVTDPRQVESLIERTRAAFGRIDVLVNNAGLAPLSPLPEMTDAVFRQLNAINIDAVFYACRAAWADLAATRGTIISISSVASVDPFPGFAAYGAAKAWVNLFTRAIADEGKLRDIKAFAVAPGAVETQMLRGPFPDFPADLTLAADDVAAMVELLLDERCRYSSGQTIFIKA